ncbi:MAG: PDGLE domain-containing protein [Endomicrobium sp.]|jgi:cobalt/nickel transport protein|nr:PDGLE domain-containing protein [Endomicrobium sp.]MDR2399489.1 PDGLE domain-containing protein [Endomicrobium sp.]
MNKKNLVFIIPIFTVLLASLFASKLPDTLETLAINYGFEDKAKKTFSLFSNYSFPFVENHYASTFLAGIIGLCILYILFKITTNVIKSLAK